MDRGCHQTQLDAGQMLLRDILQRYAEEVSPVKKGQKDEVIRIRAMRRTRMAAHGMAKLTHAVVADLRDARPRDVGNGAVMRDLSMRSSVINHARREWGVSIANPCAFVRKPATPPGRARLLKPAEETILLHALEPTGRRNPLMSPLVKLALVTAMRRGELLTLRWKPIDLDAQTAFLPTTKNGTSRLVPLSSRAVAILVAMKANPD